MYTLTGEVTHFTATPQPHYNTVYYNTVLYISQFLDKSPKCINYIEKLPFTVIFQYNLSGIYFCLDVTGLFNQHWFCFGFQQQCYKEIVMYLHAQYTEENCYKITDFLYMYISYKFQNNYAQFFTCSVKMSTSPELPESSILVSV